LYTCRARARQIDRCGFCLVERLSPRPPGGTRLYSLWFGRATALRTLR
jgi:hypothetical protein